MSSVRLYVSDEKLTLVTLLSVLLCLTLPRRNPDCTEVLG